MSYRSMLAVAAGLWLGLFSEAVPRADAAAFNVYYRPSSGAAWTYHSGSTTKAAADATGVQLSSLGYQAEVLNDGAAPPASFTGGTVGKHTVVNRGGGTTINTGGSTGGSGWSSHGGAWLRQQRQRRRKQQQQQQELLRLLCSLVLRRRQLGRVGLHPSVRPPPS